MNTPRYGTLLTAGYLLGEALHALYATLTQPLQTDPIANAIHFLIVGFYLWGGFAGWKLLHAKRTNAQAFLTIMVAIGVIAALATLFSSVSGVVWIRLILSVAGLLFLGTNTAQQYTHKPTDLYWVLAVGITYVASIAILFA